MRLIVAITGASGAPIALRLLQELQIHEVHLIVTKPAERTILHELGGSALLPATHRYSAEEIDAPIASSSFLFDAMVVVPCSVKTLAAIAHGYTENLVVRAADIALRMKRPLILVVRETPLSLVTIENMRVACLAGATIMPPIMGYYFAPESVEEVTAFFAGKILDLLGLPHDLYKRWSGPPESR